jgi:ribosomal protein L14E/L6E/L27E
MFKRGNVVRSLKGRDEDKISVVLRYEDNKVYISDGKEHKLTKPKLKNPKHLEKTNFDIDESFLIGNERLRKELNRLKNEI